MAGRKEPTAGDDRCQKGNGNGGGAVVGPRTTAGAHGVRGRVRGTRVEGGCARGVGGGGVASFHDILSLLPPSCPEHAPVMNTLPASRSKHPFTTSVHGPEVAVAGKASEAGASQGAKPHKRSVQREQSLHAFITRDLP